MIKPSEEEVVIKVQWEQDNGKWKGFLLTADENGQKKRELLTDESLDLEITRERRCIGYIGEDGRTSCPDFKQIDSGQQCYSCRQKDVHIEYVQGRSGERRSGAHSVYLVQIGSQVKVGVTRSSRLMKRWVEQGAMYAREIKKCEDANQALDIESKISERDFKERISKKQKSISEFENKDLLLDSVDTVLEYNIDENLNRDSVSKVFDVQSNTDYPRDSSNLKATRYGKVNGEISTVRGQLIFSKDQCWAITRGLCLKPPSQKSITDF